MVLDIQHCIKFEQRIEIEDGGKSQRSGDKCQCCSLSSFRGGLKATNIKERILVCDRPVDKTLDQYIIIHNPVEVSYGSSA